MLPILRIHSSIQLRYKVEEDTHTFALNYAHLHRISIPLAINELSKKQCEILVSLSFLANPEEALGNCVMYCEQINANHPELKIQYGTVRSRENPDNALYNVTREYPHCWLEAEDGTMIDPTISQFAHLPNLIYRNTGKLPSGNCCICALPRYDNLPFCSSKKCEDEFQEQF